MPCGAIDPAIIQWMRDHALEGDLAKAQGVGEATIGKEKTRPCIEALMKEEAVMAAHLKRISDDAGY